MKETIHLEFTDDHKYMIEFTPPKFWRRFAESYGALEWIEQSEDRLAIVAENYSYLLDLLVQARYFHMTCSKNPEKTGPK